MRLHARRTSSNCQKVLWFLGELGLDYEFVPTGGDHGGLDDPAFRALNPNGRVPTWVDEHGAVWESHTLLRYLAAVHAKGRFWPEDPAARSRIERWMDWSQSGFDAAFMALFWGHWRTPEADRNERLNRMNAKRAAAALEVLDAELAGHDYVVGDALSLADIPIGALLYRYANLDVTEKLPGHVASWYARLVERPAFQEHVMLPFDELKGRLRA
ncbi:MAG: glutathione S-transferase family protein [Myxococcota bacterium]|nr:glutathione S-transferase family protein [Myxococcota bacterium]